MTQHADVSALMQPIEPRTARPTDPLPEPSQPVEAAQRDRPSRRHPSAHELPQGGVPRPATKVKTFVLDTNVLLHDPKALFVFEDNNIVLPFTVLEEIDRFKTSNESIGRNAREAIRYLDALREDGRLSDGVSLAGAADRIPAARTAEPTGTLRIVISPEEITRPQAIEADTSDNRIIGVAWHLQEEGEPVVFVSKDINARIKSDALDIRTEDFENKKVDVEKLFAGYESIWVDGGVIDELYAEKMLSLERLVEGTMPMEADLGQASGVDEDAGGAERSVGSGGGFAGNGKGGPEPQPLELVPNEFTLLIDATDEQHTGLGRRLADTEHIIPIAMSRKPTFGIMARNVQQHMAMDLLLDDKVQFVTLLGSAGTGKTLLAVAAGMHKVFIEERYEKLLVARPIMPLGRDIGYLPGDKDEKLSAWMQPIFDNLSYLLSTRGHPMQSAESHTTEQRIDRLVADGRLVLEPLTYIRGRSIPHQFIIVDEAQNLTPHEVKTIVSRVGEGTKIVFTGDIEQIDNPYLDASSNGLSYAIDRMRGSGLVGHISLAKSERSELASLATARL